MSVFVSRCGWVALLCVLSLSMAAVHGLQVDVRGVHAIVDTVAAEKSTVDRIWKPQAAISMFRPTVSSSSSTDVGYGLVRLSTTPEGASSSCTDIPTFYSSSASAAESKKALPLCSRAVLVLRPPTGAAEEEETTAVGSVQHDLPAFCGASSGVVVHTPIEQEAPPATTADVNATDEAPVPPTWSSVLYCPHVQQKATAQFTIDSEEIVHIPVQAYAVNPTTHRLEVDTTQQHSLTIELDGVAQLLASERLPNATSGKGPAKKVSDVKKRKSKKDEAGEDDDVSDEEDDEQPSITLFKAAQILRIQLGDNAAVMRREVLSYPPSHRHLPVMFHDALHIRTVELLLDDGRHVHLLLHSKQSDATTGAAAALRYRPVSVLPVPLAPITALRPYGGVSNKLTFFSLVTKPTPGQLEKAASNFTHHNLFAQFTSLYRGTRWEPVVTPSKADAKKAKESRVADGLEVRRYAAEPFSHLESGWNSVFYGGLQGRPGLSAYGLGGSSSPKAKVRNDWSLDIVTTHNDMAEKQRHHQQPTEDDAQDDTHDATTTEAEDLVAAVLNKKKRKQQVKLSPLAVRNAANVQNFSTQYTQDLQTFLCADPTYAPPRLNRDDEDGLSHGCESSGLVEIVYTRNDTYYLVYDQLDGIAFGAPSGAAAKSQVYAMQLAVDEADELKKYDAAILRQKQEEEAEKVREAQRLKYQQEIEERKKEERRAKRREERLRRERFEQWDRSAVAEAAQFATENDGEWIVVREMRDEFAEVERNTF